MPKKISVISTVYNEPESWLARCFDSVTEQSDGRVELESFPRGGAERYVRLTGAISVFPA